MVVQVGVGAKPAGGGGAMRSQRVVEGFSRLGRSILPPDKRLVEEPTEPDLESLKAKYSTRPIPITTDSMLAYIERARADWATPIEESA